MGPVAAAVFSSRWVRRSGLVGVLHLRLHKKEVLESEVFGSTITVSAVFVARAGWGCFDRRAWFSSRMKPNQLERSSRSRGLVYCFGS